MAGVAVWALPVPSLGNDDGDGASRTVSGPKEWHQRLNNLASTYGRDRSSYGCAHWSATGCVEAYAVVETELTSLGRQVEAYDLTGFPRTLDQIETVKDNRAEFTSRCEGRAPAPVTSTASSPPNPVSRATRWNDLSPEEQYEHGKAVIERAGDYDLSEALRNTSCLRLVGALRTSVQDVADALEADQR